MPGFDGYLCHSCRDRLPDRPAGVNLHLHRQPTPAVIGYSVYPDEGLDRAQALDLWDGAIAAFLDARRQEREVAQERLREEEKRRRGTAATARQSRQELSFYNTRPPEFAGLTAALIRDETPEGERFFVLYRDESGPLFRLDPVLGPRGGLRGRILMDLRSGEPVELARDGAIRKAVRREDPLVTLSTLRERGWTDAGILRYLGDPDRVAPNPHYRRAAPMRLYRLAG
jgi:hypothetical protein